MTLRPQLPIKLALVQLTWAFESHINLEDDQHFIQLARAGDRDAFEALIRPVHDNLYRYIYRTCDSDLNLAEDLLQETLMTALNKISDFNNNSSFKTWLFGIATNLYRQKIRRIVMRRKLVEKIMPSMNYQSELNLEETASSKKTVNELLKQLPEGQRQALYLREILGCSLSEISEILGANENAVKNRLHHGRLKLIELVKLND